MLDGCKMERLSVNMTRQDRLSPISMLVSHEESSSNYLSCCHYQSYTLKITISTGNGGVF